MDITTAVNISPEEITADLTESEVLTRLDTIIEGIHFISDTLWVIIVIIAVTLVIKFLWTFIAKWFFGGI